MSERHDKKKTTMAANLGDKTGRSVDEWVELVNEAGLSGFSEIVDHLKSVHGLGHFQARLIAERSRRPD